MWQVRHGRQQRDQLQSERGTGFLRQWSPQAPILHLHEGSGSRPWPQNWGDMGLEPARQLRQAAWGPLEPGCGLPILALPRPSGCTAPGRALELVPPENGVIICLRGRF